MGAGVCEKCGAMGIKTYWVNDRDWLCAACFKAEKGKNGEKAYASGSY